MYYEQQLSISADLEQLVLDDSIVMVYKLEQRQVYYNFDEGDDGVEEDNWGDSDVNLIVKDLMTFMLILI